VRAEVFLPLLLAATASLAGQKGTVRPPVDVAAMREAIRASGQDAADYASSAAYAHRIAATLASEDGDHRRAVQELRMALASDDGNPVLTTALAQEYVALSDSRRAEQELKTLLDSRPAYAPAHVLMGRILLQQHRYSECATHLAQAIKLDVRNPEPYLLWAQVYLEQHEPEEAIKIIERQVAASPDLPVGYKRLGLAFAEEGDAARAEAILKRSLELDPSDFEAWAAVAQIYESSHRPQEAENAYQKALEQDPDNREVLLALGDLSLRHHSLAQARGYFDRVLFLSDEPEFVVRVAFAYLSNGKVSEASQVLDAARGRAPQEPRLSFYAGLLHERLRQYPLAARIYAAVPRTSELFAEARLHRATCLSFAGEHQKAAELFRQGLKEKPDQVDLYPAYALALERANAQQEAENLLKEAIQRKSAPELLEALASLYGRRGRTGDAIELLSAGLRATPNNEILLFALGAAYERHGDSEKAVGQMRRLLQVNPENASAMNFVGYTLADRGKDLPEAERLIRRALELQPDTGAFLDSLGWLYFKRGDFHRAVGQLEEAVQRDPDPVIYEHLGDAYRAASNRAQAAAAYRRALDALRKEPALRESSTQSQNLERKLKTLSKETADR